MQRAIAAAVDRVNGGLGSDERICRHEIVIPDAAGRA